MTNKDLIRYTISFPRRIVNYFASIKEVKWLEGKIYSIRVKSYQNPQRDYCDNISFKYPHIPAEILDHVMAHKDKYSA